MMIRPLILVLLAGVATPVMAADGSAPSPARTGASSPLSEPSSKAVVVPGPSSADAPRAPIPTDPAPAATAQAPLDAPPATGSPVGAEGDMRDLFAGRGGDVPAVIRYLQGDDVKVTSLGDEGGAKAYLGEARNGRYQVFYVSPDGEHMAAGLLFRSGGIDVTNAQVEAMLKRFGEAARGLPDAATIPTVQPDDAKGRAASDLPMMDWFRSRGLKVTPFGDREGGFLAYLVETRPVPPSLKGRLQAFYVMPDPRYAVAGVLVRRGGVDVTGLQIANTRLREIDEARAKGQPASSPAMPGVDPPSVPAPTPAVKAALDAASQAAAASSAPMPSTPGPGPDAASPAGDGVATARPPVVQEPTAPAEEAPATRPPMPPPASHGAAQPAVTPPSVAAAQPAMPAPVMADIPLSTQPPSASAPYRSAVPRDAFVEALKTAVWFQVGDAAAPVVYMVVDPQCPFCHATWQRLKPLVFGRKLQVRVVMIAGLKGSDPLARSILSRQSPSEAWLTGEGSIHGFPIKEGPMPGTPAYERAGNMLSVNANLIRRFSIDRTPFLAYVADDGTMYSSLGLPDDVDAFLAARK